LPELQKGSKLKAANEEGQAFSFVLFQTVAVFAPFYSTGAYGQTYAVFFVLPDTVPPVVLEYIEDVNPRLQLFNQRRCPGCFAGSPGR